jgi:hypothetical protein
VRLKEGAPLFKKTPRPVEKGIWLRRIINKRLKHELYKKTMEANGKLSEQGQGQRFHGLG